MEKEVKPYRQALVFVYLSIMVHLYVLWLISRTVDPELAKALAKAPTRQDRSMTIENIIVRTKTQSQEVPEEGKISDKPNLNRSPRQGSENYNLAAPEEDTKPSAGGGGSSGVSQAPEGPDGDRMKGGQSGAQPAPPGNIYTSFYTPEKTVDVTMDSLGEISLATVPREYAKYFLDMQQKIGGKWMEFAPHPYLYGAAIPRGEVEVTFTVNETGLVVDPAVTKTYGYRTVDLSCYYAVFYSGEFGVPPAEIRKKEGIVVRFRFIYLSPFDNPSPHETRP